MNINATLIGQAVAFFIFVWFCMRYVWPPLIEALNERKQSIADGLAAAERGRHEHELAERRATEIIRDANGRRASVSLDRYSCAGSRRRQNGVAVND